jgi:hypothetical protein
MKRTLICSDSHTPYNRVTSKAYQNPQAIPLIGFSIRVDKIGTGEIDDTLL